jgi:hypothetical protein
VPNNFSIEDIGIAIMTNGIDPVMRWDGLTPSLETAGIAAPTGQIVVSGSDVSGTGTITGTYYAYVIFLDRFGNQSNPSPVSIGAAIADADTIVYSNVPVPTDPKVIQRQIYRNTTGQTLTFYLDVSVFDVTTTTFYSTTTDAVLSEQPAQVQFDASGNSLTILYDVPPDWKPFNVQYLGRMYLAGEVVYQEGCVHVQAGTTLVQGVGTRWPTNFAGRFFYGEGAYEGIEIASVNAVAQQLTLVSPWLQYSSFYAQYWIRPAPAEKNLLYFSGPGTPEGFPPDNSIEVQEDGFETTGLILGTSFLYIMKTRKMYRLTCQADPAQDGYIFPAANRGCINQRCAVVIGDMMYFLDEQGIYGYDGGKVKDISKPIQSIFRGTNRFFTLNWGASRYWHGLFDENYEIIRWFVSLTGDYLPRHALCYNYDFDRWWIEEYPMPIGASAVGKTPPPTGTYRTGGQDVLYYGSRAAKVYMIGYGQQLDGPDPNGGTVRQFVTSSGLCSMTCNVANFATSGIIGSNIYIIKGTGEGQNRRICNVVGQTLWVTQPWTEHLDTTSQFQIGGIPWRWRSGRMMFADNEARNTRKGVLGFRPVTQESEALVVMYYDYSLYPVISSATYSKRQRRGVESDRGSPEQRIALSDDPKWGNPYGIAEFNFDAGRERSTPAPRKVTLDFYGVQREEPLTIKSIEIQGTQGGSQPSPQNNQG